jgi:hypothetical protein
MERANAGNFSFDKAGNGETDVRSLGQTAQESASYYRSDPISVPSQARLYFGLMHRKKGLFDHLVGTSEYRRW